MRLLEALGACIDYRFVCIRMVLQDDDALRLVSADCQLLNVIVDVGNVVTLYYPSPLIP